MTLADLRGRAADCMSADFMRPQRLTLPPCSGAGYRLHRLRPRTRHMAPTRASLQTPAGSLSCTRASDSGSSPLTRSQPGTHPSGTRSSRTPSARRPPPRRTRSRPNSRARNSHAEPAEPRRGRPRAPCCEGSGLVAKAVRFRDPFAEPHALTPLAEPSKPSGSSLRLQVLIITSAPKNVRRWIKPRILPADSERLQAVPVWRAAARRLFVSGFSAGGAVEHNARSPG